MYNKMVFHHIPKTAGSSLRRIFFEELFELKQSYWHYSTPIKLEIEVFDFVSLVNLSNLKGLAQNDAAKVREKLKNEISKKEFIGGHFTYPNYVDLLQGLDQEDFSLHVAVIRDPFERLISYWEFCQRKNEHPYKFDGSFEEALQSKHRFFTNCTWEQNCYISGKRSFNESLHVLMNKNFLVIELDKLSSLSTKIRQLFKDNSNIKLKPATNEQSDVVTNQQSNIAKNENVNPNKSYLKEYEKFRPLLTDLLEEDQKLFDFLRENDGIFCNKK
ncbi:sulfotransferase family 2 domain-containing protein [Paraglaciecola sp. 25GB23A]|uniref:sulfotransferase family 2 domain-containing protein n=1 Tax=Paraglaciecola sp. 25GB23A TaxID=3156068 RepID=UPI0032AF2E40